MAYKDPEANRAYQREWRAANRESVLASQRKSNAKHRDERNRRAKEARTPERTRESYLKHYHGSEAARWFAQIWDAQEGRCWLCGREMLLESHHPETGVIDHNHKIGCHPRKGKSCEDCRRGIACDRCNRLIGMVDDDAELLRVIANRLEGIRT